MKKLLITVLLIGLMSSGSLMAFEPFVVKAIRVEGTQRISKDAVLQDLPIAIGEQLTTEKSKDAIHALFESGFYKDVQFERDGDTLIVKVVERPSIGKLELTGLRSKDDVQKILKENNIAEGRMYDPNLISKAEKEIIHSYLMKQRYGVKVDTKIIPEDRNRVTVEMRVYEGDIATIKEIRFVGNHAFTDKQLRGEMFHKTKNWLSWFDKSDHYSKEKLAADLEMLRSYYMDRGYLNFKIESTQVSLSVDKKYVYLTISVSEGPQYYFKNITLAGDMVVDRDQLQAIVDSKIKSGAVFSRRAIWEVKDALESRLGEEGYSKAEVRLVDDVDAENRLVNLKFFIEANKRITVRRINFSGNTLTEDKVMRREVDQFEGGWISTTKIKESKENLQREGYASSVDVETLPVADKDDQVDLNYKVEEQRNAQISAGVSYSGAERLSFNLGANLRNYLGTGKDINFDFSHGKSQQIYSLGYSNPYFTESGIGMHYNIYNRRTNLSRTSEIFDYATDETGLNLGWIFRLSQYNSLRIGGGADHTMLKLNYANAPAEYQQFCRAYQGGLNATTQQIRLGFKEYFINVGLAHDSRDTYLFPTKGWQQNIDFKSSVPAGNLKIYKVEYDISWFKPIYDPYVLNLKFIAGYADVYNRKPFPFYKNFFLGGGDSVRGFEERSLGPKDSKGNPYGGNVVGQIRAQIIFPPPFFKDTKSVRMALFLDAGQVYDTHNKKNISGIARNPRGIRYSSGVGLTWNTPLNIPVAFSFAWPLNEKQGDTPRKFSFSLGTQF